MRDMVIPSQEWRAYHRNITAARQTVKDLKGLLQDDDIKEHHRDTVYKELEKAETYHDRAKQALDRATKRRQRRGDYNDV